MCHGTRVLSENISFVWFKSSCSTWREGCVANHNINSWQRLTNFLLPQWCGALNIRFQEGGAFKEDETRTGRVFILFWEGGGDFIERQWLLSAAQCVLISPSCIHWSTTAHHGSLPMPWISSRTFPGFGEYISQVICFVRQRYQGSLRAWFKWSKTEHGVGRLCYVTHNFYIAQVEKGNHIWGGVALVQ